MYLSDGGYAVNTNYASPKNMLHQWVAYHILPMRIPANKLVYHCNELGYSLSSPGRYTLPVMEWYPVYGGDRLIKIYESAESNGIYLNSFPERNNGILDDGHEGYCAPEKRGILIQTSGPMTVTSDIPSTSRWPIPT